MQLSTLILFLCAGSAACGQAAAPADPAPSKQALPYTRDFSQLARKWSFTPQIFSKKLLLPGKVVTPRWDAAQVDPGMIVHPPPSSIGALPAGKLVAQKLYPGLLLQPIAVQSAMARPFSTTWPGLKVQPLSTVWPQLKLLPVRGGTPSTAK
jgi:hypothetical protein